MEERDGTPAIIRADERLRVDFGEAEDGLEPIGWSEFFRTFDGRNLAFVYEEEGADGDQSLFYRFVDRDSDEAEDDEDESDDEFEDADDELESDTESLDAMEEEAEDDDSAE